MKNALDSIQNTRNCFSSSKILSFLFLLNPFWIELFYFIILSLIGFLALKVSKPRTITPNNLNYFFTSVSAATVTSLSTVEMEVFSNTQLVFMTIVMLFGGEVFTSMLGLHFMRFKMNKNGINLTSGSDPSTNCINHMELGTVTKLVQDEKPNIKFETDAKSMVNESLKLNSILILAHVVFSYLLLVHVIGSTLVLIYISFIPSAKHVLVKKGLNLKTFAIFTIVSTFANCGFIPTNENMMVFKKNPGFVLILIPQILMGNTLYPVCLGLVIWFLKKFMKKPEFVYMLKNPRELGYAHLLPGIHSCFLALTVFGFLGVQLILFCSLEWHSEVTSGLNVYEKLVGSLFEVVNSRHTGESVFDFSALSPAILVLFVVMMYLPPYTSFLPIEEKIQPNGEAKNKTRWKKLVDPMLFSQLSYLSIFTILICITEREKMKKDPLNFNVLNVIIEVTSAYGNVGFSTGYSCARQIHPDRDCIDACYGFAGKWSDGGKFLLILVMIFGRLKKYSMKGGKAWKLSY